MKRIGLLSDTHGYIDETVFKFFDKVDEIWHAGDIGNIETADKLTKFKLLRAVFGNIDDHKVRLTYPEILRFTCEQVPVLMTHIGGYPGRYEKKVIEEFQANKPKLFISGHSHILKVMFDKKYNLLHVNPGAAGNHGLHQKITMVRFVIEGDAISDLEIYERVRG
jgi:uncharacterized protein